MPRKKSFPPALKFVSGFTTIELITVMVLIGIISMVAISRFDNVDVFAERAFHDQLRSLVSYTRKSAVAGRRYTCVVFTPGAAGTGKAEVFIDPALLPESAGGSVDCTTTRLALVAGTCAEGTLCVPRKATLHTGAGPLTIVFSPIGQPETIERTPLVERQTIVVGEMSLAIEPITGLVH